MTTTTTRSRCDGLLIVSNENNTTLGTIKIVQQMEVGDDNYNNQYTIWNYIYHYNNGYYYNKYDWFHLSDDNAFVIVDNLKLYLQSNEIQQACKFGILTKEEEDEATTNTIYQIPLLLGQRYAVYGNMSDIFVSGGPGSTINKAALKLLILDGLSKYHTTKRTRYSDYIISKIFQQLNVLPYDTRDDNDGSERYNSFTPSVHWTYRPPKPTVKDWYPLYYIGPHIWGKNHCSIHSVGFHYIKKTDEQLRLYALLYGMCTFA